MSERKDDIEGRHPVDLRMGKRIRRKELRISQAALGATLGLTYQQILFLLLATSTWSPPSIRSGTSS